MKKYIFLLNKRFLVSEIWRRVAKPVIQRPLMLYFLFSLQYVNTVALGLDVT